MPACASILTGVTYADVYVGWLDQNYSASQFGTIGGLDFGASMVWNFSTLDTVEDRRGAHRQ